MSNIINIIERKVHKFNTLHLKCFPGFMQQLENWFSWNFHVSWGFLGGFFLGGGGGGGAWGTGRDGCECI